MADGFEKSFENPENSTNSWENLFLCKFDTYSGLCDSDASVSVLIREYELATNSDFKKISSVKNFGTIDTKSYNCTKEINWFQDGVPYIKFGNSYLDCHHGPDRHKAKKTRNKKAFKNRRDDHTYGSKKGRNTIQVSAKLDCPAQVRLLQVLYYPENKIKPNVTLYERKKQAKILKQKISNKTANPVLGIVVKLPEVSAHKNHYLDERDLMTQSVDPDIIKKIRDLARSGIYRVPEIERLLEQFVCHDLFVGKDPPPKINRRFYPTRKDIKNHLYAALNEERFSDNEQEDLMKYLQEHVVNSGDSYYFRAQGEEEAVLGEDEDENISVSQKPFLFVYQTAHHRKLLETYGSEICLMDGTYKTSKYNLSLYFVCVPTNAGYRMVGSFLIGREDTETIREGLQKLKSWNENWSPKYFMVDFDEKEINAVEALFQGCKVYICDFHREQAWDRWVSNRKNGVADQKEVIISALRQMSRVKDDEALEEAKNLIKKEDFYPKIQHYLVRQWLPHAKRWVKGYRSETFNTVNTTNGLERQHRELKYNYLFEYSDNSLLGLVKCLRERYFPGQQRRWVIVSFKEVGC